MSTGDPRVITIAALAEAYFEARANYRAHVKFAKQENNGPGYWREEKALYRKRIIAEQLYRAACDDFFIKARGEAP